MVTLNQRTEDGSERTDGLRPHAMMIRYVPATSAISICAAAWKQHGVRDFHRELADHLEHGFVVALPKMFLMAKAVDLDDGRQAWLISEAYGNLPALASMMPFPLDWIAFHRRGDRLLRIYPLARFLKLARRYE